MTSNHTIVAVLLFSVAISSLAVAQPNDIRLTEIANTGALDIKHAGDGSNRLFLAQQAGVIRVVSNNQLLETPFMDISDRVRVGQERGLLSIAFPPDFETDGQFYAFYTNSDGNTILSRFDSDGQTGDPDSEQIVLDVFQPMPNHNGGRLEFGPDGMLYLGLGDGGGANDTMDNAQNDRTLLGKLIRIDVESGAQTYAIPTDNPFVNDPTVNSEIWAKGLRNPWRMAFDRDTGDLYIADVGQELLEEISVQPASSGGGENYGWNIREGMSCFGGGNCDTTGLTDPVFDYSHAETGGCSITGGQVYRGPDYPALQGMYIYGDFCAGTIWGLQNVGGQWQNQLLIESGMSVFTFGEDERGNVYLSADNRLFLISDGEPQLQTGVPFDGSFSGTYIINGLNDQGFFVTVGSNVNGLFLFIAWFTYDQNGDDMWLVGNNVITADSNAVTMGIQRLSGLNFLEISTDTAIRDVVGDMTITAIDCDTLEITFDFGALGAGTFTLNRLTNIEGRDCSSAVR